jgi:hypothetical protein
MVRFRIRSMIQSTTQSAPLASACPLERAAMNVKSAATASLTADARRYLASAPVCGAKPNATRQWFIRRSIGVEARTVSCGELGPITRL